MTSPTLMVSVSGMRGIVGTDLTPELVARHAAALGAWARQNGKPLVVGGRDARDPGRPRLLVLDLDVGTERIDDQVVPTVWLVELLNFSGAAGRSVVRTR